MSGQETGRLRERIAEAIRDAVHHCGQGCEGQDDDHVFPAIEHNGRPTVVEARPETLAELAEAVVQPELDARDAEIERLTEQVRRASQHMGMAIRRADTAEAELDAADARHRDMLTGLRDATLRAEQAEAERDRLKAELAACQHRAGSAEDAAQEWELYATEAAAERDDYAARLKATDRSWSEPARERDRYRLAWQSARGGRRSARFQVRALEKAFDRQNAKAETALTAFTSVRDELTGVEAERDRLREAVTRVREILDYFDGQVTALENGNPAVGSAFRFTFNKIRAALDQPEDQPETP